MLGAVNTFALVLPVLGAMVLIVGAFYIVRSSKITAGDNQDVKAVTMLTGQLAALSSKVELQEAEIRHLRDLNGQKDLVLARNLMDIQELREALTQRAAVEEFRSETREWFRWLGVSLDIKTPMPIPAHD